MDEEELNSCLHFNEGYKPSKVYIRRQNSMEEGALSTAKLENAVAILRCLVPRGEAVKDCTSFINPNGQAGFNINYESAEEAKNARLAWDRSGSLMEADARRSLAEAGLMEFSKTLGCGLPIRFNVEYSSQILVHSELLKFFKEDIDTALNEFLRRFGISSSIQENVRKKWKLLLTGKSHYELEKCKAKVMEVFKRTIFTHKDKHVLFGRAARSRMEVLCNRNRLKYYYISLG